MRLSHTIEAREIVIVVAVVMTDEDCILIVFRLVIEVYFVELRHVHLKKEEERHRRSWSIQLNREMQSVRSHRKAQVWRRRRRRESSLLS